MIGRTITYDHLENYENSLYRDEKSRNTVEKYMRDVRKFFSFAGSRAVDKLLTLEYKAFLNRDYLPSSANSMIAALNSFLRFCGWDDCCVKSFKVQSATYCSEDTYLSKDDYLRLVRCAEESSNKRLSLIIQTICATGIRVSELNYITVEAVKNGEAIVSCKGKIRKIFIVSSLRNKLLAYIRTRKIISGPVFVTKSGHPVNRSNIWKEMKSLCGMAGIDPKKVFPHNLRHLFARTFYSIEKDIAKLADILGHASVNTTRIYIISTGYEHKMRMENMKLIL